MNAQGPRQPATAGGLVQMGAGHGGRLEAKQCRPCPIGSVVFSITECRACPRPNMIASVDNEGECECAPGFRSFSHSNGWWGHELTCIAATAYTQLVGTYTSA